MSRKQGIEIKCVEIKYVNLKYVELKYVELKCVELKCVELKYVELIWDRYKGTIGVKGLLKEYIEVPYIFN